MKCANCPNEALFEYQLTAESSLFYCEKDLPKFLESRKRAGLLKLTEKYNEVKKEALKSLTPSAPEPEEPEKESKPKKATKKKSE